MKISLSNISNINNINDLAQYYDQIRAYAHQINPQKKEEIDDIVQDCFIKLDRIFKKYPDKVIDGGYIALTLTSLYKNYRKNYLNKNIMNDSPTEEIDDSELSIKNKEMDEIKWEKLNSSIQTLSWYEKKVLEYSFQMSLSELSRKSDISYKSLTHTLKKIKLKLFKIKDEDTNL